VVPLFVFLGFLGLVQLVESIGDGSGLHWLADPKYWIFPLQTVVCAALLLKYWRSYDFGHPGWGPTVIAGVLALMVWVSPQLIFSASPRIEGFNPSQFEEDPAVYWFVLLSRFARLVIIVPLVEEIFWRGFLMRYLVNENFVGVKFGTYSHLSFFGVAVAFMFVHAPEDWPAALVTGILFGWVAVKTGSLLSCVLAHAITNLLLGFYIVSTKQWGFW
jgi:CAAX prenyl protease-like protein